jgi:hypothetical protein
MSENTDEPTIGISDEDLPEDLQPSDDNPLAQPLDEDEAKPAEELDMQGGKTPEQDSDRGDEREEDDSAD